MLPVMQNELPTYIANDATPLFPDFGCMSNAELAEYEPPPERLAFYQLHTEEGLKAFLYDVYWIGYPGLFVAVNHVWSLLIGPRSYRCTLMGQMSGAGGSGKQALVKTLNQFIEQALATCEWDFAPIGDFGSLENWHQDSMAKLVDQDSQVRKLVDTYASILNGAKPLERITKTGEVIAGPWRPLKTLLNEHRAALTDRAPAEADERAGGFNLDR